MTLLTFRSIRKREYNYLTFLGDVYDTEKQ
jgi:hypothetical protein